MPKHKKVSFLVGHLKHSEMSPRFELRVTTRGFRESNQPDDSTRINRCIKYDYGSNDLTINLMLTWCKRSLFIRQLEFEV
jgi:hypothetical protein